MIDLRHVDCMEYLATCEKNAFDLAIVDPPYGVNFDGQRECKKTRRKSHEFKGWDTIGPDDTYFAELTRVSKRWIAWGANCYRAQTSPLVIAWDKMQWSIGAEFEIAHTSFSGPNRCFRMARCQAYTQEEKIHPTQKPTKLYEWLLMNYAKEGDRILDTHLGSGSIAIACHNLGFDLVGCELDQDYYNAACERLDKHKRQLRMF